VFPAEHGRLSTAWWHARQRLSEWRKRLRTLRAEHEGFSSAASERLSEAQWQARQRLSEWGVRLQALRTEHRGLSTVAMIGLLLALAVAGTGAALLAGGGHADAVAVNYTTRYVTVTGPGGTQTYEVTRTHEVIVTEKGKRENRAVRTRVVTGPDSITTLRGISVLPGQVEQLPGRTTTIAGPTKTETVMVTGPGQTVTQAVTEVVTVTTEVPVTVTESGG
jgi:hypothetical protein